MNPILLVFVLTLTLTIPVNAQEPADSKVKAAIYEIDRAEKQLAGANRSQASKLKRIVRMIDGAEAQLQSSENQQHESWVAAQSRLEALKTAIADLEKPEPVDPNLANQLSDKDMTLLESIDRRTNSFIRMVSEYDAADMVRLQSGLAENLNELKQLYHGLQKPDHPEAIAVAVKIIEIEKQINTQISARTSQEEALGDVESAAAAIWQRLSPDSKNWHGSPVPDAPFSKEIIQTFSHDMNAWRKQTEQDISYLHEIDGKTDKVDTRTLLTSAQRELASIDTYNDEMARRMEQQLLGIDQIGTNIDKAPASRLEFEIGQLQQGLALLKTATEFDAAVGRTHKPTAEREQRYTNTLAKLRKKSVLAATAATATPAKAEPKAEEKATKVQEIQIYNSRLIEIMSDGEIWIDGGKAGDITDEGEIWVAGGKEGDLTTDGEVWKAGNKVGDITGDGEVWLNGDKVGHITSDGEIWINGSREGWFTGGAPSQAAALIFYGFFRL